jgi:hypothetical protein
MNKQWVLSVDNLNQSLVYADGDPPGDLGDCNHRRLPLAKRGSTAAPWLRDIYNSRRRHSARAFHPAQPCQRPQRTTPRHPEFSRHQGIYCVALKKGRTEKSLNLPSGHAMSSRRLFLSGLLSSRARLRLAGLIILPTQTLPKLPSTYSNNPNRQPHPSACAHA